MTEYVTKDQVAEMLGAMAARLTNRTSKTAMVRVHYIADVFEEVSKSVHELPSAAVVPTDVETLRDRFAMAALIGNMGGVCLG